ncbi:MAG: hypothetical protein A3J83_06925, partial [Elusimicrobia bacterium RIFOXYA2_FULL_40_6]
MCFTGFKTLSKYFIAVVMLLISSNGYGDFSNFGVGARAQGMGNSFAGISNDVSAIYFNPAGLSLIKRGEFIADYSRLNLGMDDGSNLSTSFIGIAQPINMRKRKKGTFEYETQNYGTVGVGVLNFNFSGVYQENSVYLSYSRQVINNLYLGGSAKFMSESYIQDLYTRIDPVFEYGNKGSLSTVGLDAGALYIFLPQFFYGISIKNINQPEIGLSEKETLKPLINMGVGYGEKNTSIDVDMSLSEEGNNLGIGFERWFGNHQYALRSGLEFGSREYKKLSLGSSYNMKKVQIDYSFSLLLAGLKDTAGTHRISFVYKFGRTPKDELEPGSLEEAFYELETRAKQLEADLQKTELERQNLEKVIVEDSIQKAKQRINEVKIERPERNREERSLPSSKAGVHTVTEGDTLQSLAQKYYGDSNKWLEIFNANKDKIGRGGSLIVGQTIGIPQTGSIKQLEQPQQIIETRP